MGRLEDIHSLETFLDIPSGGNRGISPNFPRVDLVGEVLGTCRINVDTLEITRVEDEIDAIESPKDEEKS